MAKLQTRLAHTLNILFATLALGGFGWAVVAEIARERLEFPDPAWLLAAAAISLATQLSETGRVVVLTQLDDRHWTASIRISLMANLLALLPAGWIGGDAFRVHKLAGIADSSAHAISGVALARIMGMAATLTLFAMAAPFIWSSPFDLQFNPSGSSLVTGVVLVALVIMAIALLALMSGVRERSIAALLRLARNLRTAVLSLPARSLIVAGAASLLIAVSRAALLWAVAFALSAPIAFPLAIAASAIGVIVSIAPFMSTGIGLREAAIAGALASLGVELASAILIATAARLFSASVSLFGWACLQPFDRSNRKIQRETR